MPSYSEPPIEHKSLVIERFLALPCFATVASIESVIGLLPIEWRSQIKQSAGKQRLKEYVFELLEMCAAREEGFTVLLAAMRFYDGGTLQLQALVEELGRLKLQESLPRTCRASVPARTRLFTGRKTELTTVRTALTESGAAAICAVHGMGGVGKTTLATEYVHRYGALYGIIGWFRLADETEKADSALTGTSVAAGYAALATELGLAVAHEEDYPTVRRAVLGVLAERSDWLLVFDNAEDPAALREHLPATDNGHILITSRNPHWHALVQPVALDAWDAPEALAFLLGYAGRTAWRNAAEEQQTRQLVTDLGGLPLALTQAAAFMAAGQIGVAKYHELFNKRKLALFKDKPLDYHATVVTTWSIGIEASAKEQPKALPLLNLCAFFAPEPIRFELLQEVRAELGGELAALLDPDDEYELTQVRAVLRRYALATVDETSLTLHPLVALVTREKLVQTATEYTQYAEYNVRAINKLYPYN